MKNFKLSKTSWLILAAGLFVVVLAGLGMTRSQQSQQLSSATAQLQVATMRLNRIDTSSLQAKIDTLQQQIKLGQANLTDATARLNQSVVSADVAEEFYTIAGTSGVIVNSFTSSPVSTSTLSGIPVATTNIAGSVTGKLKQVIDFISNLNSTFRTGYVQSATIQVQPPPSSGIDIDADASANLRLVIYSYSK